MAGEPQWKEPSGFTRPKRSKRINPLGKRGRQRIAAMAATPIEGPCEADIVAVRAVTRIVNTTTTTKENTP